MTVQEAIDYVDKMRPNQFDTETKVEWLSKLDGQIFREVVLTHEGFLPHQEAPRYVCDHMEARLLVPCPYDEEVYGYYLMARIDKENAEFNRYNQDITMYNNAYLRFQNFYNRTHTPLPRHSQFRF